jgi:NAD kinase
LEKIKQGKYIIENHPKLVAMAKNKKLVAMNDITVHNGDPRSAIRYKFAVNGRWTTHEIIGDGVVLATPLGSTGYYRSITDSFFEVGIGLAFNNSTEQSDHMVLKEDSKIELEITRGPAMVFVDNVNDNITLELGDVVTLQKSDYFTKIVRVN